MTIMVEVADTDPKKTEAMTWTSLFCLEISDGRTIDQRTRWEESSGEGRGTRHWQIVIYTPLG